MQRSVVGQRQVLADPRLAQPRQQVVGVQHRDLGRLAQALARRASGCRRRRARTRRSCPGSRAAARSTAAGRASRSKRAAPSSPSRRTTCGTRQVRARCGRETAIGPDAGPAAAVGLGERLVQVEVHDVEAHVAGPGDPHDGVQVRAVVVERRAGVVDDARDLLDVRVEEPERVRVGEHQAGDAVVGLGAAGPRGRRRRRASCRPSPPRSRPS